MRKALGLLICGPIALLSAPAFAEDCVPSPEMTLGIHYEPDKAVREDGDIGRGLVLHGRILSALDCEPLPGAKIVHWQADSNGAYVDRLRVWRLSDEQGAYRFETEWPNLRPPHVHFIVEASGYRTLATMWVSRQRVEEAAFDIVLEPR